MNIAVVGGGINGVCCVWELAARGHQAVLYERGELMGATSSASSKLLHGGLRYLAQGHVGLVRESLRERGWWLEAAPALTSRLEILLPVYRGGSQPRWRLRLGLLLYDLLAGRQRLGWHRWVPRARLLERAPNMAAAGLRGAFAYYDGRMDDHALGLWAAEQARQAGARLYTHSPVTQVSENGGVRVGDQWHPHDRVINVAGPWAAELLRASGLEPAHTLSAVRGSHLVIARTPPGAFLLDNPDDGRVVFVLPWQGHTLLGTTEVRQPLTEPPRCSDAERDYLLGVYNRYFTDTLNAADVLDSFAGIRPLVGDGSDPGSISREYVVERRDRLISVYGGKWTTARALARKVADTATAS